MDLRRFLFRCLSVLLSLSFIDVGVSAFGWSYRQFDLTLSGTVSLVRAALLVSVGLLGLVYGFFVLWRARRWVTWFRYWLQKLGHNMVPRFRMPREDDFEDEPGPDPPELQFLTFRGLMGLPADNEEETKQRLLLGAFVTVVSVAPSLVGVTLLQVTTPFSPWVAILVVNLPLALASSLVLSLGQRSRRLAREADAEEARQAEAHSIELNRQPWYPPPQPPQRDKRDK